MTGAATTGIVVGVGGAATAGIVAGVRRGVTATGDAPAVWRSGEVGREECSRLAESEPGTASVRIVTMRKPTMLTIAVSSCFHTGQPRKSEAHRRRAAVRPFCASACDAPGGRAYNEAGIGFGRGRWAGSDGNRTGTSLVTLLGRATSCRNSPLRWNGRLLVRRTHGEGI